MAIELDMRIDGVMKIHDMYGRMVENRTFNLPQGKHHLELSNSELPAGMYVLSILETKGGRAISKTFVKK